MKPVKKETIIFTSSHLYLFWTTGVYYLWELSNHYKIVLFVGKSYGKDHRFQSICKHLNIYKIIYYDDVAKGLLFYKDYYKICRNLIYNFKPVKVYYYNFEWLENHLLACSTRQILTKCKNIVYQNAQVITDDYDSLFMKIWEKKSAQLVKKYFIPLSVIRKVIILIRRMKFFYYNILGTLMIVGFIPKWRYNRTNINLFDEFYVYLDSESRLIKKSFELKNELYLANIKLKLIDHPVASYGKSCNRYLYRKLKKNNIVIMPSYLGLFSLESDLDNLKKWIELINIVLKLQSNKIVHFKFHPNIKNNPQSKKITQYLVDNCPTLKIINPSENAQELILQNEIIISDVSTVLWWASFLKNKKIISINFSNFENSDAMKRYEHIHYVEDLRVLGQILK
mgnify:CR=1 FL=1